MLSKRELREIERIVNLPRQEFLACLSPPRRRIYLRAESAGRKYFEKERKAIESSERNIDYDIMFF